MTDDANQDDHYTEIADAAWREWQASEEEGARMIDLLYVAYNRLEFTRWSFGALIDNTNWDLVSAVHVQDDGSTDGTAEHLEAQCAYLQDLHPRLAVYFHGERVGGPVAAMNAYLELEDPAPLLAKVDNDFVMSPGWLDALHAVLQANPDLDIIGTEPGILLDVPAEGKYEAGGYRYRPCEHIGGKGLMRVSAFDGRPMHPSGPHGYFGFTEWQVKHEEVKEGWIDPDLRCFGLDQLPRQPFQSLTKKYVTAGWQRRWPPYGEDAAHYWDWWTSKL